MAKAPITVVWASTTSNKETLDTTRQGNGIVFESDIVSNFVNSALYINSQATRNLQVMGGYYDGGQEYKNYQYCSQIEFVGGEYVLNYYMATQDNPTLAPTNATSYQQGTTDMEIPTNGSSVQSGWQQLNTVPNQSNIAYKNKENHFTQDNMFDSLGDSTLKSGATLDCDAGALKVCGLTLASPQSVSSVSTPRLFLDKTPYNGELLTLVGATGSEPVGFFIQQDNRSTQIDSGGFETSTDKTGNYRSFGMNAASIYYYNYQNNQQAYSYENDGRSAEIADLRDANRIVSSSNTAGSRIKIEALPFTYPPTVISKPFAKITFSSGSQFSGTVYNYIEFLTKTNYSQALYFGSNTVISNASFGSHTRGIDPVWEQDYATANYVNQKLQELFDYLDTRLATIENKLGISSAKARARGAIDARAMINNIAVPKSKLAELFERLENLEGYEGVLGYSNEEERMEIYKSKDNEEAVMQVMDSIKARMEAEAKEREAQEAQQKQENSVDAENQEVKE